ncbi:MAG: MFS transporter [Desulfurococcales archaeon]|nr:MFS transporter [Desulfurococcales archaeon]
MGNRLGRLLASTGLIAFSIMFSISIVGPLLSSLAEEEGIPLGGKPNTSIGVIFALGGLALALAQAPLARAADRLGRRGFVLWGSVGVAASVLLIGYSRETAEALGLGFRVESLGWDASTVILAVARTLQGVAAAATWPVLLSIIASSTGGSRMGTAMGVFGASFGLGMALGPVIGPALAAAAGIHAPFLLSAALALASAAAALPLPRGVPGGALGARGSPRVSPMRDPLLLSLGLIAFTLLYAMGSLVVIYPRYMLDVLHMSMRQLALAMALASLTYALLQPVTGRLADLIDKRIPILVGHPLAGASVALAGLSHGTTSVYASMLLFGAAGATAFPAATAMVGLIAPRGREGAYTGVYNALLSLGVTVSPIAIGLIADTHGYPAAFSSVLPMVLAATLLFAVVAARRKASPSRGQGPQAGRTPPRAPGQRASAMRAIHHWPVGCEGGSRLFILRVRVTL